MSAPAGAPGGGSVDTDRRPGPQRPAPGESVAATVARLAGVQKSSKGAPAYSRFVNRRLGRLFAAVAFHLGLTPNLVTLVSAAFSFTGIAVISLAGASWPAAVTVVVLLVLGYSLDAADGQLARLRGGGSLAGEWLDHIADAVKVVALHVAVAVWVYRSAGVGVGWTLVPLAFSVASSVLFFAMILNDQLRTRAGGPSYSAPSTASSSTVRSLLVMPTDYGLLCLVFVLLGAPRVFLGVYTAIAACTVAFLAAALVKWFRDVQRLDAAH